MLWLVSIARCVFRGRLRPQPEPRYAVCLRSKATESLEAAWRLQLLTEWAQANISYQVTNARRGLRASRSRFLSVHSGTIVSSRCEGRNADGGEAVDSGTSRLCTRGDGVLSRCTTSNLLSPPRFAPLLSASLLCCVSKSEPLQTPAPSTTHIPRLRRATPPMSSTPLGGLPFCLLSRSGTQKQRCHVLYSPIAL